MINVVKPIDDFGFCVSLSECRCHGVKGVFANLICLQLLDCFGKRLIGVTKWFSMSLSHANMLTLYCFIASCFVHLLKQDILKKFIATKLFLKIVIANGRVTSEQAETALITIMNPLNLLIPKKTHKSETSKTSAV